MDLKRGRGRPPNPKPATPAGPAVFLTREQLAERWHTTPTTITRKYQKMGVKKIELNGRWLCALSQIEEIERKLIAGNAA
jgi:hypothetical protein